MNIGAGGGGEALAHSVTHNCREAPGRRGGSCVGEGWGGGKGCGFIITSTRVQHLRALCFRGIVFGYECFQGRSVPCLDCRTVFRLRISVSVTEMLNAWGDATLNVLDCCYCCCCVLRQAWQTHQGHLLIEAQLNGRKAGWMLLDTGRVCVCVCVLGGGGRRNGAGLWRFGGGGGWGGYGTKKGKSVN